MIPTLRYGLTYSATFLVIVALALWLTWPAQYGAIPPEGMVTPAIQNATSEEGALGGVLFFFMAVLVVTIIILVAIKLKIAWVYTGFMAFACFTILTLAISTITTRITGVSNNEIVAVAGLIAILCVVAAFIKKNIRVGNIMGLIIVAWVSAAMGLSFTPWVAWGLILLFALYDAIAVYVTKHMVTMAGGILSTGVPVGVMIFGTKPGAKISLDINQPRQERKWLLLGWGDLAIPAMFVVSANSFLVARIGGISIISIGSIFGAIGGYFLLGWVAEKWPLKAHAGLPPLVLGISVGAFLSLLVAIAPKLIAAILIGATGMILLCRGITL